MFFEVRSYKIRGGRLTEWVEFMDCTVIPYQEECGMEVIGPFVDEQEADVYVWIRGFDDEEQRAARYAAVYGG